jgi:urocanate hydratase
LTADPIESAVSGFTLQVEQFYAGLISAAESEEQASLGGKLLFAGQLDADARALLVAANIAGAASLAATADVLAGRQAMRDGVVDFLVTSLDEALRILKNELRQRQAVAVCVALPVQAVAEEMRERGVLPDLERPFQAAFTEEGQALLAWRVAASPALWLPKLDALALDCLPPEAASARRWLQLAPRYLGRLAQGERLLRRNRRFAAEFIQQARRLVESGEIPVPVEITFSGEGELQAYRLAPPG